MNQEELIARLSDLPEDDVFKWIEELLLNSYYTESPPVVTNRDKPYMFLYGITKHGNVKLNNRIYQIVIKLLMQHCETSNSELLYNLCLSVRKLKCTNYTNEIIRIIRKAELGLPECEAMLVSALSSHIVNPNDWHRLYKYLRTSRNTDSVKSFINLLVMNNQVDIFYRFLVDMSYHEEFREEIGRQVAVSSISTDFHSFCYEFFSRVSGHLEIGQIAYYFTEAIEQTNNEMLTGDIVYKMLRLYVLELTTQRCDMNLLLIFCYERSKRRDSQVSDMVDRMFRSGVIADAHIDAANKKFAGVHQRLYEGYNYSNN